MKNRIHEFDCGIYPRLIWVAIGVPTEELNEFFEGEISDIDESSYAEVTNERRLEPSVRGGLLIRFSEKPTTKHITHESTHAAMEIFAYIGAEVDLKNQEPFSYLCGWIADCIDKVINWP